MSKQSVGRFMLEFGGVVLILTVFVLLMLPAFSCARGASWRASCQSNLKQMGEACKMYSNESRGEVWPPRSAIPDNWILDAKSVFPEYLSDLSVFVCPDSPFAFPDVFDSKSARNSGSDPACVSSLFYTYTGVAVCSDEAAWALFELKSEKWIPTSGDVELDVPEWPGNGRVNCGGQAGIPVMWDRVSEYDEEFSHRPTGINVLHLDGHVKFVTYSVYNDSSWFPATRVCAQTFGSVLPKMPGQCYSE